MTIIPQKAILTLVDGLGYLYEQSRYLAGMVGEKTTFNETISYSWLWIRPGLSVLKKFHEK